VAGGTHTFLFTDLVGFTALAASEGDDRAADVALEFVQCVEPLAREHDADVVKRLGDGLMLRSGDPARAVRLGLAIVAEQNERVPVRVGMHTGPAVERGGDWYGTTVNVAARLCGAAGGGEVLVSETTRDRAGRLRKLDVGDHRLHWLKNLDEPVGARVVAAPEPRAPRAWREQVAHLLCASPRMKEAL
jgi:class 3 adenylate cyclase